MAAPISGTVAELTRAPGEQVTEGTVLLVLEAMKMQHPVPATADGTVADVLVAVGDVVAAGRLVALLSPGAVETGPDSAGPEVDLDRPRPDLAELQQRRAFTADAARPEAVARRHAAGRRTARENIDDLCDEGSFVEYGALAIAAQRTRRPVEDLVQRTPADGLIAGVGRVGGNEFGESSRVVAMSYDYLVLAGTQGQRGHAKKDRLFELAERSRLPVVLFAEGGGLGEFSPDEVGPAEVQRANGVIDVAAADDADAVALARKYLSYFQGDLADWEAPDQRALRHAIPQNRLRVYGMRQVVHGLADVDSVLELRGDFGHGAITALARVEGRPLGVIASNPAHLGGAIDSPAADKIARFLQLCDAYGLPVLSLCDTPGFMVGPEVEKTAAVRHVSRIFVNAANLTVPFGTIVLRKGYGLGAQAMAAGGFGRPRFIVAWPTGEFGPMGLEGAVRLGYRKELDSITDPEARKQRFAEMVAAEYERGKATNVASAFEIDDVIDPAESRRWITALLTAERGHGGTRSCVDTW